MNKCKAKTMGKSKMATMFEKIIKPYMQEKGVYDPLIQKQIKQLGEKIENGPKLDEE